MTETTVALEPILQSNTGSRYTDDQRRQAVIEYATRGNLAHVSRTLGIPETTLGDWKHSDWWHTQTVVRRALTEDRILSEVDKIIELANRETIDRLENGNVQLVKTAEGHVERRVPMNGKDAATISAIHIDKRQILLNKPTSISSNSGSDAIKHLAAQFEQLSRQHSEKVIEGRHTVIEDEVG